MSTIYNRRRGAKANRPRTMRVCADTVGPDADAGRCSRFAPVNRYCSDHQTVRAGKPKVSA